jgi:lipopolysaccharide exporter
MSIKSKAINGAKWTTVSTAVSAVLQFAQVAIVARMLAPASFGIVSISTLIINFLSIFAHFGFANSIIHKQESNRRVLSTIYFFNIIIGIVLFAIIYLCIPLFVAYYKEPALAGVLKVSAFYFPIVFIGQIYNIMLEKELRFRTIALIEISGAAVAICTTIVLAYKGFEAMALIYGMLAGQTLRVICQNIAGRKLFRPVLYFKINRIKDHLKFGAFNVADSLLGFANTNIDSILIGGILGVNSLGYYTIAYQIAVYPVVRICPIITQICYPLIAKMKDNMDGLRRAYLAMTDFIFFVNIPLLGGLFIMAPYVIPLIYGDNWIQSVPLTQILVFMSAFMCIQYSLSPIVYTKGKPNYLFYLNLITFIIKMPAIYLLAINYGVNGCGLRLSDNYGDQHHTKPVDG